MNKKSFLHLYAFILAVIVSIGFVSCGDDDNDDMLNAENEIENSTQGVNKENLITKIECSDGTYTFTYDDTGKLIGCRNQTGLYGVSIKERAADSVYLAYSSQQFSSYLQAIKLNNQGLCETTLNYSKARYNSEGYLVELYTDNNIASEKYSYQNGNLAIINYTHNENNNNYSYKEVFTSSSELNDANLDLNYFFLGGSYYELLRLFDLLGKKSKNILSSYEFVRESWYPRKVSDVDVTRDSKGRIVSIRYNYSEYFKGKMVTNNKQISVNYGIN